MYPQMKKPVGMLMRIWNPNDFQGQRSRSLGQICRQGDTPRFAFSLLNLITVPG